MSYPCVIQSIHKIWSFLPYFLITVCSVSTIIHIFLALTYSMTIQHHSIHKLWNHAFRGIFVYSWDTIETYHLQCDDWWFNIVHLFKKKYENLWDTLTTEKRQLNTSNEILTISLHQKLLGPFTPVKLTLNHSNIYQQQQC